MSDDILAPAPPVQDGEAQVYIIWRSGTERLEATVPWSLLVVPHEEDVALYVTGASRQVLLMGSSVINMLRELGLLERALELSEDGEAVLARSNTDGPSAVLIGRGMHLRPCAGCNQLRGVYAVTLAGAKNPALSGKKELCGRCIDGELIPLATHYGAVITDDRPVTERGDSPNG